LNFSILLISDSQVARITAMSHQCPTAIQSFKVSLVQGPEFKLQSHQGRNKKCTIQSQVWWYMLVIPALGRLRQEHCGGARCQWLMSLNPSYSGGKDQEDCSSKPA
jgi:hypothetical protein